MTTLVHPPVLMYQDISELVQVLYLYEQRRPMNVLEIGSAYGGTLWLWRRGDLGRPAASAASEETEKSLRALGYIQ